MMFAPCTRSATTLTRNAAVRDVSRRFMSVFNLSDGEAVQKFGMVNNKSVLYFTASWCGPCQQIKPLYEEMSKTYAGVAFGKVDVDENSDAASQHQISAVPTFVLFDGEKEVEKFSGADAAKLETLVKELEAK